MITTIPNLFEGAIERIMHGETIEQPVLQILGTKGIKSRSEGKAFRLLISDGLHIHRNVLVASDELNQMQINGLLSDNTIVRLDKYKSSAHVLNVFELTILISGDDVNSTIGDPVVYAVPDAMIPNFQYIANLNSKLQNWVIKARVTMKSDIIPWKDEKGCLFKMNLTDKTGEIQATVFTECCENFNSIFELDKIYWISNGLLKLVNENYSIIKHDYVMHLTDETEMHLCDDLDTESLSDIMYKLVPISEVRLMETGKYVDVIGICTWVGNLEEYTSLAGNECIRRDLWLTDQNKHEIQLTLWNSDAENFDGPRDSVVFVKSADTRIYNDRFHLNAGLCARFVVNPNFAKAHKLREWYNNESHGWDPRKWITLKNAQICGAEAGNRRNYFWSKASIRKVKYDNVVYMACSMCKTELVIIDELNHQCRHCLKDNPKIIYQLRLKIKLMDSTSKIWVTCFNDVCEMLLRRSASNIKLELAEDSTVAEEIFKNIIGTDYVFNMYWKYNIYTEEFTDQLIVHSINSF